ncbi:MAG: hypothetical protein WD184_06350 [Acidimicrobiia bacterium]
MRRIALGAVFMVVIVACSDDGGGTTSSVTAASTTTTLAPTTSTAASTSLTAATTTTLVDDGVTEVEVAYADGSAEVTVDGEPESGRVQVALGTEVRLTVSADVTSEVHVHGYDETADVSPGSPAVIEFTADIPGIFEVELHAGHTLLVELQIS